MEIEVEIYSQAVIDAINENAKDEKFTLKGIGKVSRTVPYWKKWGAWHILITSYLVSSIVLSLPLPAFVGLLITNSKTFEDCIDFWPEMFEGIQCEIDEDGDGIPDELEKDLDFFLATK